MKIITEICDVCSLPLKEGQLFELKISGKITSELKRELKRFEKDEERVRGFFMPMFREEQDERSTKKVISFNSEICQGCAVKITESIMNHRKIQDKELKGFEKMFTKKEEVK